MLNFLKAFRSCCILAKKFIIVLHTQLQQQFPAKALITVTTSKSINTEQDASLKSSSLNYSEVVHGAQADTNSTRCMII